MSFEPIQYGKYKLIQPLAQGGMAEIFLAKQQGPAGYEKTVVIKRVLAHYSNHPDFVAMFLDEARLAAQLSHPNIVQIYDFGETDGSYYLCMEYLRGEDLHTLVKLAGKKGVPIPPQVAATIISASSDALHYAHTLTSDDGQPLHIVHRDISPSNLFVTYQGVVKVLDFGIARAEGKVVKTATGMIKGKLAYMAPEQAKGENLDGRSDVWALGAVLHELLTGKRLFWRNNDVESFRALLDDPIPVPSVLRAGIPGELDDVCHTALQRDLAARFPSAQAMHAELDDFLSSRTYVPSQTLLQQFLHDLVGEEVISSKLKSTLSKAAGLPGDVIAPQPPPRRNTKASGSVRAVAVPPPPPPPAPPEETRAAPATASVRRKSLGAVPVAPASTLAPTKAELPSSSAPVPVPVPVPAPVPGPVPVQRPSAKPAAWGVIAGAVLALGVLGIVVGVLTADPPPDKPKARPLVVETVTHDGPGEPEPEPEPTLSEPEPGPDPIVAAPPPVKPAEPEPAPPPAVVRPQMEARPLKGLLDVNCVPWCRIFIDGKDTTRISPAIGISLSPGKHRLRVVNTPTGVEQEKDIVIRAGATTREVVKF